MARRCKVCGEPMTYTVGEHYRDTGRGMVLYKDVRLYTCPAGCRGTYYDYRRARPADRPERVFFVFKAPAGPVNVVGPLLGIGLGAVAVLMIAGFLVTTLPVGVKSAAIALIVAFGVWIAQLAGTRKEDEGAKEQEGD